MSVQNGDPALELSARLNIINSGCRNVKILATWLDRVRIFPRWTCSTVRTPVRCGGEGSFFF